MRFFVDLDGRRFEVDIPSDGDVTQAVVDGNNILVDFQYISKNGELSLIADGHPHIMDMESSEDGYRLQVDGLDMDVVVSDERSESIRRLIGNRTTKRDSAGDIKAPMPGLVVKLLVGEGDTVGKGQGVIVVEAMKMENEIASPVGGTVQNIKVEAGQTVNKNELMLVIK